MSLIPFNPFQEMNNIRREMDRLYRFPYSLLENDFTPNLVLPPTDIYETEEQIIVTCDLPGLQKKEDINLQVRNNELTISGVLNKAQQVIQEERMHRKERFSGHFRRTFTLPASVSGDKVKAIYKNGVLSIFLPKSSAEPKHSVDIEFEH